MILEDASRGRELVIARTLVCGLFRMSDALTSGNYAHRYYGLVRMRCRLARWTLRGRRSSYVNIGGRLWHSLLLII